MEATSLNTKLRNRTLWYDGDSTFSETDLANLLMRVENVSGIFAEEITSDLKQYNSYTTKDKQICVKKQVSPLLYDWVIPEQYKTLDVRSYVIDRLIKECDSFDDNHDISARTTRTTVELKLYEKAGLFDFLRTLIYVINTLESRDVVWGVGRGSSVSSYVLYLIGVHDVDSVLYQLDLEDFLHISGEA